MIQELQTGILDINNKYTVDFSCKQLDDIILKIIVYDKSLPADLSDYNVRLKAFKADQVPLIQNTNISIKDNSVTIKASKQLTTTQGIVKAELQFINKTTLEKKSTFYINIEVIASVLDVEGTVSTPTCTILKEIDHKLDQIENIGEVLDQAKEVRDTLTNTTIPGATNINSKLENNINNASTKITEVKSIISSASNKIEEVETSVNNANTCKKELDLSKTNADISKENLDAANVLAKENIEELNKIGDAKELATKVETNKNNIEDLQEKVEDNTSQLKENTQYLTQLSNPNLLINGGVDIWQRGENFNKYSMYTADRWRQLSSNVDFTLTKSNEVPPNVAIKNSMCIEIENCSDNSTFILRSYQENLPVNVLFTLSYWIKGVAGAKIASTISDFPASENSLSDGSLVLNGQWQKVVVTFNCKDTGGCQFVDICRFYGNLSTNMLVGKYYIAGVKLELGSVATPFVPRPYGEEEMLCQRYYLPISATQRCRSIMVNNNVIMCELPVSTTMRINPTLVKNPNVDDNRNIEVARLDGTLETGFAITYDLVANAIRVKATKNAHGLTDATLNFNNKGFDSEIY
ncbi:MULTISPECIES: hypothetical protein [unclassified Clostridium]|uniref:hypothetical protein n=1 Tax=unclassified Clostridium TaxID=2614128 RepID=UPI002079B448|nr:MULTISPECIES: hypothetical protein [unclassified Clostridium]